MQVKSSEMEEDLEFNKSRNYVDEKGNVYILGEFDDTIATHVIAGLVDLIGKFSGMKSSPPITVYIDSPGGYTHNLFTLITLLNKAKEQGIVVVTVITGNAYSSASMLAAIGTHRVMSEYSTHLMHYGQAYADPRTPKQLQRENAQLQKHFEYIESIYVKHSKMTLGQVKEFMSDDSKFLSAEECLELGLVDEIILDSPHKFESKKKSKKKKVKPKK